MKHTISSILVAAFLIIQTGIASAAANGNASVGTKELLARVEALENAILNLQTPNVAGASFRTTFIGNLTMVTGAGTEQLLRLASAYRTLFFNNDGTATWTLIEGTCRSGTLKSAQEDFTFQMDAFCTTPPQQLTYVQTGSNIDLYRLSGDYYATMTVNHDGSVLMISNILGIGPAGTETGALGYLTIGLRISD
jgi:hypothetical protein